MEKLNCRYQFLIMHWRKHGLDSNKASIRFLSDNNDDQNQQFNQLLKLLKTELEFEEQKLRMLTKNDGVFYEASFNQNETKTHNFDKCGEGKDITKREM